MTAASERYSDKRVSEDFTCYVLFTEPLQADVAEILAALREDYPALDWPDPLFPGASGPFETGAGSSVVWMGDLRMSLLGGLRRCDVDFDFAKNHLFPGAQQAVAAHQSYLSISVGSAGPSFVDRFQAAKRMTCFAALFAKLPVCSAVYFPNSDGIVAPRRWVEAAERAISDDFPIEQWITFPIARFQPDDDGPPPVSCNSIGMAAFNGHEVAVPMARKPAPEVGRLAMGAVYLQMVCGSTFRDSNTIGVEGSDKKAVYRFAAEGHMGFQTDTWVILDETCRLDEDEMFGPRPLAPPPPGYDNTIKPQTGFLKRVLRGGRSDH